MEFSGLVTVASMFYRAPGAAGGANGGGGGAFAMLAQMLGGAGGELASMREMVTAHEVAHQWWHGLVGSDSRAHPFVDESLAQWSALFYLERRYGRERAERDGAKQVKSGYQMMRMMGTPDARADQPVEAFGSSIGYAGIVYGKAPYLWDALRRALGDEAFLRGVRAYVTRYRFGDAPARGLVDVLARGARAGRVRALARRWLDETHGDEDLGQANLSSMLGGALGGGGGADGPGGQRDARAADALDDGRRRWGWRERERGRRVGDGRARAALEAARIRRARRRRRRGMPERPRGRRRRAGGRGAGAERFGGHQRGSDSDSDSSRIGFGHGV